MQSSNDKLLLEVIVPRLINLQSFCVAMPCSRRLRLPPPIINRKGRPTIAFNRSNKSTWMRKISPSDSSFQSHFLFLGVHEPDISPSNLSVHPIKSKAKSVHDQIMEFFKILFIGHDYEILVKKEGGKGEVRYGQSNVVGSHKRAVRA